MRTSGCHLHAIRIANPSLLSAETIELQIGLKNYDPQKDKRKY